MIPPLNAKILFLAAALIDELDLHAVVEERKLAQALGEDVVVVFDVAEDLLGGEEMHFGAAALGLARHLERCHRVAHRNSIACAWPSRLIVSRSHSESALTTDTPTPCRPPEIL